jgi:guanine deaminase
MTTKADVREGLTVAGTAFHTPTRGKLEVLENCLIEVDKGGAIVAVISEADPSHSRRTTEAQAAGRYVALENDQFLLPGLIDLHVHAPQWAQLGKALDAPLEEWLQKYTFPLEARFSDLDFARKIYTSLVQNLLANGTTTALYFATIHNDASLMLVEECLRQGQRALVGRVAMDEESQSPAFYRDATAASAIHDTEVFIASVRAMQGQDPLVLPVVTPRFIPTSTPGLLHGLGELARRCNCHIQTHCSESDWEVEHVHSRFGMSDAQVLDHFGLLSQKTVLAHSNFITDADIELIRLRGSAVAHCPLSNTYFADAVFPLRAALDKSVKVGLGTDISAGYSPSIFDSARSTMVSSRILESGVDARRPKGLRGTPHPARVTIPEAFWLATTGGADALSLPVGSFAVGRRFDAIAIGGGRAGSNLNIDLTADSKTEIFEKLILHATRADVARVWVNGRQVA